MWEGAHWSRKLFVTIYHGAEQQQHRHPVQGKEEEEITVYTNRLANRKYTTTLYDLLWLL